MWARERFLPRAFLTLPVAVRLGLGRLRHPLPRKTRDSFPLPRVVERSLSYLATRLAPERKRTGLALEVAIMSYVFFLLLIGSTFFL